jgi:endonuclease-3
MPLRRRSKSETRSSRQLRKAPKAIRGRNHRRISPRPGKSLERFLHEVDRRLRTDEIDPHGNHLDPLDEIVFIILSAQTEYYLYRRTYSDLKASFTPWEKLLGASEDEVAGVIRQGGLARKKAQQLKSAFAKIINDCGRLSLQFLKDLSDAQAFAYLISLPGVGPKSAKCVMMYSLGRAVFPVDTHVWRVCRRLGLTPPVPKPTVGQTYDLEAKIPKDLRYRLHVTFVTLGQQTCHTYYPRCVDCMLSNLCPSSGRPDTAWNSWRRPAGVWSNATPRN